MREPHDPPIAQLSRPRTENKRITLLIRGHELAHVPRITRAITRNKDVSTHGRQRRCHQIDGTLTAVTVSALHGFGYEGPASTRHFRRPIRRSVDPDDDDEFLRIDRARQLIEHAPDALLLVAGRDNDGELRSKYSLCALHVFDRFDIIPAQPRNSPLRSRQAVLPRPARHLRWPRP